MRHVTEPHIRSALAEYNDALRDYEAAKHHYAASKEAYFAAGDRKAALEAKAAQLLKGERGLVTYDFIAYEAVGDRLKTQPVAREIRIEQETLPLAEQAHG